MIDVCFKRIGFYTDDTEIRSLPMADWVNNMQEIICEGCGEITPSHDTVNFSSEEGGGATALQPML